MCTAATYKTKDFYFGRTLDCAMSYGEEVVITPRDYVLEFEEVGQLARHYAIIGMAHVAENYPLYYEAMNERGLAMAGLNFVGNARYFDSQPEMDNIAQFEFIPWILGQCASVTEARQLLSRVNLSKRTFGEGWPLAELHWMIADVRGEVIVVESVAEGLMVYDNPVGVMTNNPPFPEQMFALNNYMNLSAGAPRNSFAPGLELQQYSRGMGALGLPGDLSSQSRFVRVAFTKMNSVSSEDEDASVNQFFHILNSVEQQRGCCYIADEQRYEISLYTSCSNVSKGVYYYTTYGNHQISAVDMHKENLDSGALISYPIMQGERVFFQN